MIRMIPKKYLITAPLACLAVFAPFLALGQQLQTPITVGHLVDWIEARESKTGLFQWIKSRLEHVTGLVIRVTSPDVPPMERRLWRISAEGGKPLLISTQTGVRNPRWGTGNLIVYEVESDTNGDGTINMHDDLTVQIVDPRNGATRDLGVGSSPVWSPDGGAVAFIRKNAIQIHRLASEGEPSPRLSLSGNLIFTDKRSLAFAKHFWSMDLRNGEVRKLPAELERRYLWLGAVSPSGAKLVMSDVANTDIFIRHLSARIPERNLTEDPFLDMDPAWSPDERYVVYVSDRPPR